MRFTVKRKTSQNKKTRRRKYRKQRGGQDQAAMTLELQGLFYGMQNLPAIQAFLATIEQAVIHGSSPNPGTQSHIYHVLIHGEPHGDDLTARPMLFFTIRTNQDDDIFTDVTIDMIHDSPQSKLQDAKRVLPLGPLHNSIVAAIRNVFGVET